MQPENIYSKRKAANPAGNRLLDVPYFVCTLLDIGTTLAHLHAQTDYVAL